MLMASDFQLTKCVSNEHQLVDRISQLPNDILVDILSFLPLEDAARTSVLSKRWIGLWMFVTRLDFDPAKILQGINHIIDNPMFTRLLPSNRQKYDEWVNKVLLSHKAIILDTFRIRFFLDKSSENDIDKWLQYAFARRVRRLDLDLLPYDDWISSNVEQSYDFPPALGNSSAVTPPRSINSGAFFDSLRSLRFNNVKVSGAFFDSLRSLRFNNVKVSGSVLEFFLYNCPFLEHLAVANNGCLKELKVCGPSLALKHLEIMYCFELLSVTVCNTNIVSLRVSCGDLLVLKNVPKLVDVYDAGLGSRYYVNYAFSGLHCCLSKLEVLTLDISHAQLSKTKGTEVAVPQLTKLKQLTFVQFWPLDVSLSSFTSVIRASPNLEKFVLKTHRGNKGVVHYASNYGGLHYASIYRSLDTPLLAFPLQHLKVVEIAGYCGHKRREVELVKYLVKNGVALERIIIEPRDQLLHGPFYFEEGNPPPASAIYRNLAKQQLRNLVPSHVELVIL